MSETTCPVFYPTDADLWDITGYIERLEIDNPNIGICKLVPPSNWNKKEYNIDQITQKISTPIKQIATGRGGSYHVLSLEVASKTLPQFKAHASQHRCELDSVVQKERLFWKSLGKGEAPLYGADVEGTLFDESGWSFQTALKDILRILPSNVSGVNTSMLYVGMWRAMFAFHVEDMDLYSINYIHTGDSKSWYSVAPDKRKRFEAVAEGWWAAEFRDCKEYLRHKTKLFSPTWLHDCGLPFQTVVQNSGEFVVTFPGAYHAGFNHGFNIAEATNFATTRWLEIGHKAKPCVCRPNSVFLDVHALEELYYEKLSAKIKKLKATMRRTQRKLNAQRAEMLQSERTSDSKTSDTNSDKHIDTVHKAEEAWAILLHEAKAQRSLVKSAGGNSPQSLNKMSFEFHTPISTHGESGQKPNLAEISEELVFCVSQHPAKVRTGPKRRLPPLPSIEEVEEYNANVNDKSSAKLDATCKREMDVDYDQDMYWTDRPASNLSTQSTERGKVNNLSTTGTDIIHPHKHAFMSEIQTNSVKKRKVLENIRSHEGKIEASTPVLTAELELKSEARVKDKVVVKCSDDSVLDGTVGFIAGIEGKLARVHVKGQPRQNDRWIPLRHCHVCC